MQLPSLQYNFDHAQIDVVSIGPRKEFTLTITVLTWEGSQGQPVGGIQVRFGGVENLDQITEFFAAQPQQKSELTWLRYDPAKQSKSGHLYFEIQFERIDARLQVRCSTLQVSRAF